MRTWTEIDIDALKYNFNNIKGILKPHTKIMSVVKADAYGHGYRECCKALLDCGSDAFAVATIEEAAQIRKAGFDTPVLILGAVSKDDFPYLLELDVMPAVFDVPDAQALSQIAQKSDKTAKIHIKIDTGMSRLGFSAIDSRTVDEILKISRLPNIEINGIFSHFACADEKNPEYTYMQFERFMHLIKEIEKEGVKIPIKHIANSAAIMMYPEMQLDMVRPGIILYGYYPSSEVDKARLSIKPVMTLKSRVAYIKELDAGVGVSYGKEYITDRKTKIATIPIGYADGYIRALSKKAKMEAGGELASVVGRICMDQCMIDVTNVNNIDIGDEVTIFGNGKITADDVAGWIGTINYEVLCLVERRVPRIYKEGGKALKKANDLEEV
ncbi:MAG: alanine racemase [Firmicutes bacterium]|nr:alanine racemase [Bacillota bacterium]